MTTSSWTQDQLDALEAAIAEGVQTVKYQDKEVTYRSLDEMIKVRSLMRKALGVETSQQRVYATVDKGLFK
jgi:hypothetical protein